MVFTTLLLKLFSSKRVALRIGAVAGVLVLLYAGVLADLAHIWSTRDDFSHGFFVLPISIYLVWARRAKLRGLAPRPGSIWGLCLTLLAGAFRLLGEAGGVIALSGVSLPLMIMGLTLFLLGKAYVTSLAFPIAYLFLMIPFLDEVIDPLHWPFQLLTAKMGVGFLQMLGFSALVEQQYIVLPNITLEVAKACSGMRYLISILAVGLPVAYVTLNTWSTRGVLIGLAIAIGVVANWARVVLIGVLAYLGAEVLHGPLHIFQAMFVAWIGFAVLAIGAWKLSKMEASHRGGHVTAATCKPHAGNQECVRRSQRTRCWWTAMGVLAGFLALSVYYYDERPTALRKDLAMLPVSIGSWRGWPTDIQEAIFRIAAADQEALWTYRNTDGEVLGLYVAYLSRQRHRNEIVDHRSAALHGEASTVDVVVEPEEVVAVNRGYLGNGRDRIQILFWYVVGAHIIADRYQAKLATMLQRLTRRQSHGALVLITRQPSDHKTADIPLEVFARDLIPHLRSYLP